MSTPVSINNGPFTTNAIVSKKFLIIHILNIWISVLPSLIEVYLFWKLIKSNFNLFIIIFPIQIYIGYIILVISSIITSKILLSIINYLNKPEEGVFSRCDGEKNYYYWSLRAVIKKWPIWVSKFIPLPFVNNLNFRWFHNDSEFIELGKNVFLGHGCSINASMVLDSYLIIKKVTIEDNVVIGSNSFIAPGTHIYKNSILVTMSITRINQKLKPYSIYGGIPAKKIKKREGDSLLSAQNIEKNIFNNKNGKIQKKEKNEIKVQDNKFMKNMHFNLFSFGLIFFISNAFPIIGIIYYSLEFFIPCFLQNPNLFNILKNPVSFTIFLITPIIIIILILFGLFILIFSTKIFYKYIQYFNPVREGCFHWENKNSDFKNYFKHSFILRYLKWKLQKSLFPWLIIPAFNFVGNCRIGEKTIIEASYIAKEFLEVGNNVYLGKSLFASHLWDTGLTIKEISIGDNVTISDNCCIAPGTIIEDNVSLLPLTVTAKYDKLSSNNYYFDKPLMPISKTELKERFNLSTFNTLSESDQGRKFQLNNKDKKNCFDLLTITNNVLNENTFSWLNFVLIWLSIFPTSLIFIFFFDLFSLWISPLIIICFLPISIILYYGMFILFIILFAKLILIIVGLIHNPIEGVFKRSLRDKDYFFFLLRRNLKSFSLNLCNYFPLPWIKILALRAFNIKIHYNTGVLDSFIDSDFIEIGNNVILGEGSIIMSSMIFGEYLIVKKVIIHDRCTIGALSLVVPGTIVEEGAILGMGSYSKINQLLEKNYIHIGRPAKKWKKIDINSNQPKN